MSWMIRPKENIPDGHVAQIFGSCTQKKMTNFFIFVNTDSILVAIIILVKPPNTLYSFTTPHKKKYLLLKKTCFASLFYFIWT